MTRKALVTLAILAGLAISTVRAELPPAAYDALRVEAHEALIIEVESVKTKEMGKGATEVVLTARVVSVERSKAGLKKGGKVTIRYGSLDPTKAESYPGVEALPVLKKGEFYPAFLNKEQGKQDFEPAASDKSFAMTPAA